MRVKISEDVRGGHIVYRVELGDELPFFVWKDGDLLHASHDRGACVDERHLLTREFWDEDMGDICTFDELVAAIEAC